MGYLDFLLYFYPLNTTPILKTTNFDFGLIKLPPIQAGLVVTELIIKLFKVRLNFIELELLDPDDTGACRTDYMHVRTASPPVSLWSAR